MGAWTASWAAGCAQHEGTCITVLIFDIAAVQQAEACEQQCRPVHLSICPIMPVRSVLITAFPPPSILYLGSTSAPAESMTGHIMRQHMYAVAERLCVVPLWPTSRWSLESDSTNRTMGTSSGRYETAATHAIATTSSKTNKTKMARGHASGLSSTICWASAGCEGMKNMCTVDHCLPAELALPAYVLRTQSPHGVYLQRCSP